MKISDFLCNFSPYFAWEVMTQSSFASDLPRNLTIKCSVSCTKFILKNLYLAKNSLCKKPIFLRETARRRFKLFLEIVWMKYQALFLKKVRLNNLKCYLLIYRVSRLTHFSLETPKRVTGKQWRPRSVAAECSIWSGSPLFANSFFSWNI